MWKTALLSLAVALSTAQGLHLNGFNSDFSWDQMIAELVTGTRGDTCYIRINGEEHLLEKNDDPFVHPIYPCVQYTCESYGPIPHHIQCPKVNCPDGTRPETVDGQCCKQCLGVESEPPCLFEEWSSWTECSRTCGGGVQSRSRTFIIPPNSDFVNCVGRRREERPCQDVCCPENCLWEWGDYSPCTHTCGEEGTKMRFPTVTRRAECGGSCDIPPTHTERCNTHIKCPECTPKNYEDGNKCDRKVDKDCDGVVDVCDNCIYAKNRGQENRDGDCTGDVCDPDYDNDGYFDIDDKCVKVYNPGNRDRDGDGIGDCCDPCTWKYDYSKHEERCYTPKELYPSDRDGDGLPDECDNCPKHYNPEQFNPDGILPCKAKQKCHYHGETLAASSDYDNDKKGLTVQIMEKLLEMYYSN